ncbi:L-threonylcarbamoyladenylate synthase [Sulfurirhabdus autotrophica]|uniref:Threonylcarbamoyl-AMP synthase n=1 Tax=Sulfurirhabdus autotrophica TaxID=1706046 RepID=A0A4R3YAY5_9PROT|nr:L-threonylcarbamoyladenylate synthase [Sulfurirhabdus autotrophica]TCV89585.1 translation factor SUA5 [Sulfurirhabdus autotrophica]
MKTETISQDAIHTAVELLRSGEIVAFPTETVYGLGADAANPLALRRVFEAKGRPVDHPLIVHIADSSQLSGWARDIPDEAWQLAESFWPGPLTLILQRHNRVLNEVTGGQDTVGLRVPDHPVAAALLREFGGGVAAPSANRFGRVSPTKAQHVRDELGAQVSMVLDGGPCRVGVESSIISLVTGRAVLLRPGGVLVSAMEDVLRQSIAITQPIGHEVRVPGALASHYAPVTPLELHATEVLWQRVFQLSTEGSKVVILGLGDAGGDKTGDFALVPMPVQADEYARVLYSTLRSLDSAGFDFLLIEAPPDTSPWLAVRDRLRRAAQGTLQMST